MSGRRRRRCGRWNRRPVEGVSMALSLEKHGDPRYIICDLVQAVGGDGLLGCQ